MQCLVNARNLPDHGFAEVVRLAREVPAHAALFPLRGPGNAH